MRFACEIACTHERKWVRASNMGLIPRKLSFLHSNNYTRRLTIVLESVRFVFVSFYVWKEVGFYIELISVTCLNVVNFSSENMGKQEE